MIEPMCVPPEGFDEAQEALLAELERQFPPQPPTPALLELFREYREHQAMRNGSGVGRTEDTKARLWKDAKYLGSLAEIEMALLNGSIGYHSAICFWYVPPQETADPEARRYLVAAAPLTPR